MRWTLLMGCLVLGAVHAAEVAAGTSKGLPCPDSDQTYDLYLPRAYQAEPERRFPVLFVSDPAGRPNWHGLEPWAERQGVVMVTINGSRNGPWEPIRAAQKAVTAAVFAAYRLHPCLRFAMGFSGGAWASTVLAADFGADWAGVVLCGHGHDRPDIAAKHVLLGYHMGRQDEVYRFAKQQAAAEQDRRDGFTVQVIERDVAHVWAGTEDLVALLDWMLERQRIAHPRLDAAERQAALERLADQARTAAALPAAAERQAALERLLGIADAGTRPELLAAREAWLAAVLAGADDAGDPVGAWRRLDAVSASPWTAGLPAAARKDLARRLGALRSRKEVRPEIDAAKALAQVQAVERRIGTSLKGRQQVAANYRAIAQRWPGTAAGQSAQEAAARVDIQP